jgi:hypothetical protein
MRTTQNPGTFADVSVMCAAIKISSKYSLLATMVMSVVAGGRMTLRPGHSPINPSFGWSMKHKRLAYCSIPRKWLA